MGLESIFSLFSSKQYGTECVTLAGEKVKSKAEKIIADYLLKQNIRYQYEKVAKSHGLIFSKKISKPDFYLPDYNTYIEYWGLIKADNKKKRSEYERNMKWKMRQYHHNRIKFISIYPDNLSNLDWIFKKKLEKITGISLINEAKKKYCIHCGIKITLDSNFCSKCGKKQ